MKTRISVVMTLNVAVLMAVFALLSGNVRPTIAQGTDSFQSIIAPNTGAAMAAKPAANSIKILVDTKSTATLRQIQSFGGQLLQDYGAFSLWTVPASQSASLANQPGVTLRPDFDSIWLRNGTIDTQSGEPAVPDNLRETAGSGLQFWMVQFAGPVKADWLTQLQEAGLEIVIYMPNNAYVVWGQAPAEKLAALAIRNSMIQWTGAYHPAYRLAPALQEVAGKSESAGLIDVTVQFYTTPATRDSLEQLLKLGGAVRKPTERILGFTNITLQIPADQLIEIANWNDVFNVEPWVAPQKLDEIQDQILAGNIISAGGVVSPNSPGYIAWLASKGFPSTPTSYPIVDIVDDGIDQGNASNVLHPDFHELGVLANPDRVIYIGNCTTDASGNGVAGHGNLNAGIVGAYNNLSGFPYVDANGYRIGLGVSPYGRVAGTKIFRNSGSYDASGCGGTDSGVVAASYNAGAQLTSNSWGANVGGAYNTSSQAYDQLTRDASSVVAGNQEMLHVFAAGNAGPGANTVGSPATGKNVLSVGATENVRDEGVVDGLCSESAANNADDIATFSSRGPTDDSRYKPEIMGPGTHVQGPASQDPGFDGSGVCGGPSNDGNPPPTDAYYPAGQTLYTWSSGTSHSTPAIAGTASLLWNYYGRVLKPGFTPSPAMIKALLLNSVRYLQGSGTGGTLPSNNQGWGDANLGLLFDGTPRVLVDESQLFTASGQTQLYQGAIMDPSKPFRVTLAWTDPPGSTTGNSYVNNLDLEVTVNSVTYKGNVFSGAFSVAGGTADTRNNVESVFLPAGASGSYTVRVIATNIAGDGVPGNASPLDQDFALVIYNNVIGPSGTLMGQVRDASTASPIPGTFIGVASSPTQTYNLIADAGGNYSILLPEAIYTVTAAHYGYLPATLTGVSIVSGTTTTQNISLTVAPTYVISGFVRDSVTNDPLYATINVIGTPFNPPFSAVQTDPATGFYSMSVSGGQSYTLTASALLHTSAERGVAPISDRTENFDLVATTQNGGIIGYVRDFYTNLPLAQARVTVAATGNPSATTDASGYFQILGLAPGFYTATASANLYASVTLTDIQVLSSNLAIRTFLLPSSRLSYAPAQLQKTLTLGSIATDTAGLVISSTGTGALDFQLFEQPTRFDPFGYTWRKSTEMDGPAFAWIDATDGTALGLGDDEEANITLPFSFSFYTSTSTLLRVGNNGGILFGVSAGDVAVTNEPLTSTTTSNLIAPFWDDVDSDTGNVYWKVIGTAPNRRVVIEWFNRPHFSNIGSATFEAILFEDGDILYQYLDTNFGNASYDYGASASIGIRGPSNAYALQYSFNTPSLQDNFAICFDYPLSSTSCGGPGFDAITWISESPITGTLAPASSQNIQLVWNTAVAEIAQPGTYTGTLQIKNNDPTAQNTLLPITLQVDPTPNQGLLTGVVSSAGVCDASSTPLTGAAILLQGTGSFSQSLVTGVGGGYSYWLDSAQSPYTITVSYAGHLTATQSVAISGGVTTTQNVALRVLQACITVSPNTLQATLPLGSMSSQQVVVTSSGVLPLNFQLFEATGSIISGGGPDAFGYTWVTPSFNWIDATGGTALGLGDDDEVNITSPFPVPFYGGSTTALRIGNNGAVLYNATSGDVATGNVAMSGAPDNFIAPFWDDIDSDTGNVYWTVIGSAPNRRLVVEWFNRPHFNNIGSATFELVLYENGNILYQYLDVDFGDAAFNNGASATVGIRGTGAANSLQYSFNTPSLSANQAICFVRPGNLPCGAVDVPWLSESITGTVGLIGTPPTSQNITVTFDAAQVTQTGVYTANLVFLHNTPQAAVSIPVTLTVGNETVDLSPSQAQSGAPGSTVTYTLQLTNTGSTTNTFTLSAGPHVWNVTIPITSTTLAPSAQATLTVSVDIPIAATPGQSDAVLITANGAGGATDNATLTTMVPNTYGVDLSPSQAQSGAPGSTVTYTLQLTNTGSTTNTFTLSAGAHAWNVTIPVTSTTLAPLAQATLTVSVDIPLAATPGQSDMVLITANGVGGATDNATLTTMVPNAYSVDLSPSRAQSGAPGSTVTYTLQLTNTGSTTNTFTLSAGSHAWNVTIPVTSTTLAPSTQGTLNVLVTIPLTATTGLSDTVSITASGSGGATDSATLTTTAVVTRRYLYLPIIQRQ